MVNSGARWLEMSRLVTPAGSIYNRHEAPGSEAGGRFGDEVRDEPGLEPAALTASEPVYTLGFRDADGFRASVARRTANEQIAYGREVFGHLRPKKAS
jgi:hypothetical protein